MLRNVLLTLAGSQTLKADVPKGWPTGSVYADNGSNRFALRRTRSGLRCS